MGNIMDVVECSVLCLFKYRCSSINIWGSGCKYDIIISIPN